VPLAHLRYHKYVKCPLSELSKQTSIRCEAAASCAHDAAP
jgi:hypothetical protein